VQIKKERTNPFGRVDNLVNAAAHVCAWRWFCALGDLHPNTVGYGVIAAAFEQVLP
jgi:hypothetical protein